MRINAYQIDAIISMSRSGVSAARIAELIELMHTKHIREQAIIRAQNELARINIAIMDQVTATNISVSMLENF